MAQGKSAFMIVIIVPSYNEEPNLATLFENLKKFSESIPIRTIILVNDGSTDGTAAEIERWKDIVPLTEIRFPENRGVGAAFEAGFKKAEEVSLPSDIIVSMEADNTSDLAVLKQMIARVEDGSADVSLASCYAAGGGVVGTNFFRIILSKSANFLVSLFAVNLRVSTYSSFYRAYSRDILVSARKQWVPLFSEPGFVCMVEFLIKLSTLTTPSRIIEVPMTLDLKKRKGKSKMKVLKTMLSYGSLFLRLKREGVLSKKN